MRGGYDPATKGCIDNNCGQMSVIEYIQGGWDNHQEVFLISQS
jgi:hypothetical protein